LSIVLKDIFLSCVPILGGPTLNLVHPKYINP